MLDHPLRHIVQNAACYLPGVSALQEARSSTGGMNNPAVMAEWFSYIERDVTGAGKSICGTTFVEIGPGHSIGVALNLLKAGAKDVYALDVKKYADLATIDSDLREHFHYVIVNDKGDWPINSRSIDVVYSYFSGEHLRYPSSVVELIARVLRRDGLCIFVVDLEDHAHRDTNWQQFLYYGPTLWNIMFSRRGAWTNRLLEPDWRDLFKRWFGKVEITAGHKALPECFDHKLIAASFRKYPESVLSTNNLWIVASSPQ